MRVTVVTEFPENPEAGVLYARKKGKNFPTEGFVETSHSLGKVVLCKRMVYLLKENGNAYEYILSDDGVLKRAVWIDSHLTWFSGIN